MPNYNVRIGNNDRNEIISYILDKKKQGKFTVVDVGGSHGGWSRNVIDAIIDFNDSPITNSNIKHFKCDITHPDSWNNIIQYIRDNGKFDFCICTHTLEDIMNPAYVCEQIVNISNNGYISVPSKYKELSRFELGNNSYRGYIHHRWIFDIVNDNVFLAYPKINYVENSNIFVQVANNDDNKSDLSFFWKDNIDIRYINNNFLGPNVISVINYYNNLIN